MAIINSRLKIFLNTLAFIIGFTLVFVALGASIGFLSQFIQGFTTWIARVGGVVIILFGLITLGVIKISWFQQEHKLKVKTGSDKTGIFQYFSSFFVGSGFAIGWTPCVGPILGAILALASTTGSIAQGTLLLLSYSAGLMLPFLIAGIFTQWASGFFVRIEKYLKYVNYLAGVLLIALGILIFTEQFSRLVGFLFFLGAPEADIDTLSVGAGSSLTFGVSFIAGLTSFLAPCVFVLIPAFLAHLAGVSLSDMNPISNNKTNAK